jgi:hypothetical protein
MRWLRSLLNRWAYGSRQPEAERVRESVRDLVDGVRCQAGDAVHVSRRSRASSIRQHRQAERVLRVAESVIERLEHD